MSDNNVISTQSDSPQKCKENDKIMEKLSDPESVSNHKRTIAASVPQPPVVVKEENDNDYTLYNPGTDMDNHSELAITFEPEIEIKLEEDPLHCSQNTDATDVQGTGVGIHSESIQPMEELMLKQEPPDDTDNADYTSSTAAVKIEIEIDIGEEINDMTETQSTVEHNVPEADSPSSFKWVGHNEEKPYYCNMCDKTFAQIYDLKRHIRTHTGEKPYACKLCDKKFALKGTLSKHIITHTDDKPYACKVCEKKFSDTSLLNQHINLHAKEKPFACKICDNKFTLSRYLKKHMRTHTGERPYACKLCDKKFALKGTLNKHVRTHTGDKRYACHLCDKKFTQSQNLKKHIRSHTGEKPYTCTMCHRKFTEEKSLNRHVRLHTGEMPYACKLCEKKFNYQSCLKKHIKVHAETHTDTCDKKK